jgi:alpha-mannosidase
MSNTSVFYEFKKLNSVVDIRRNYECDDIFGYIVSVSEELVLIETGDEDSLLKTGYSVLLMKDIHLIGENHPDLLLFNQSEKAWPYENVNEISLSNLNDFFPLIKNVCDTIEIFSEHIDLDFSSRIIDWEVNGNWLVGESVRNQSRVFVRLQDISRVDFFLNPL